MGIANKYNKGSQFNFQIPEGATYIQLEDVYKYHGADAVVPVRALYINHKSQYGDAPVIVIDNALVNAPQHMTETVLEMIQDQEVIDAVNNGLLGFTVYEYQSKNAKGTFYSVKWVDIEPAKEKKGGK